MPPKLSSKRLVLSCPIEKVIIWGTYGGMVIITSFSSKLSSCSSYSMLTSQPFPLSEGQQLTEDKKQSKYTRTLGKEWSKVKTANQNRYQQALKHSNVNYWNNGFKIKDIKN